MVEYRSSSRQERSLGASVQPVTVTSPSDGVESEALVSGPAARPESGPSRLNDPDQRVPTITRCECFGQPVAGPPLGIYGHSSYLPAPAGDVEASPGSASGAMALDDLRIVREFLLVEI